MQILLALLSLLFCVPALAKQPHRYRIEGEVFADVGALDPRPHFVAWVHKAGYKEQVYKLTAVRIDRHGMYFLRQDQLPDRPKHKKKRGFYSGKPQRGQTRGETPEYDRGRLDIACPTDNDFPSGSIPGVPRNDTPNTPSG